MTAQYDPIKHAQNVASGTWRGFMYPPQADHPIPWHPDGDQAYRGQPTVLRPDSKQTIEFLKEAGEFHFNTGSVVPDRVGKVNGVFLNQALPTDVVYTISRTPGPRNLLVKTGYTAPYGRRVRINSKMVIQGYPMRGYSDQKLHVYDPIDETITEIQYLEATEQNAVLNFFSSVLLGIFGRKTSRYTCHGVRQIDLKRPSTEAQGSSAANLPISTLTVTHKAFLKGETQLSSMAVKNADHYNEVWPAEDSDGPVGAPPGFPGGLPANPHSIKMGQILRLNEDSYFKLLADDTLGPQARFVAECWFKHGLIVVDTGGQHATGVDLNAAWDQKDLNGLNHLELDDFSVWEFEEPY